MLEIDFGHRFPSDFKSYIERFPSGVFGMVAVFHPLEPQFALADGTSIYVEQLLARNHPANGVEELPPFGNGPGELISWGTVNGEFELCWQVTSAHPDTWTCVVADVKCESVEHYPGGMLELLLDVLGGTGRVAGLDYLRELLPMDFYPRATDPHTDDPAAG